MTGRDANYPVATLADRMTAAWRWFLRLLLAHVIASYIVVPLATTLYAAVVLMSSPPGQVKGDQTIFFLWLAWVGSPIVSVWLMVLFVPAGMSGLSLRMPEVTLLAIVPGYWLMFALTILRMWARRRPERRHKQGLCPECGYDLRAHTPGQNCPECGTPVPEDLIRKPMA